MKTAPVYFQMSPQMLAPGLTYDSLEKIVTAFENGLAEKISSLAFVAKYKANDEIPVKSPSYTSLGLRFDKPVCGGSHGDISPLQLCDAVVGKLREAKFPAPLFAVVNHNSAHHISYPLAQYGFETFGGSRKRVVINFDQHDDFTSKPKEGVIRCSTWGWFVTNGSKTHENPLAHAYVTIGQGKELPSAVQVHLSGRGKVELDALADSTDELNIEKLLSAILHQIDPHSDGSWADWAVYLSFDRDMMISSCTPYGDGHYTPDVAREAVKRCLAHLKKGSATLVGCDLMGLPTGASDDAPSNTPHRIKPGSGRVASDLFAQAVQDCLDLYKAVTDY